jgi:Gas vesicle synthesis protein GvpL/GvpF
VIYLYALTEPSADVPAGTGFDDAPLQMTRSAHVAALYSTHRSIERRPQPDALVRHEQVVEAAMRQGPTLPARFGTTFVSDDALRAAVDRAGDRLGSQLQRVRGCVELAVRVGFHLDPDPAPRDGRGYLEARLAERRELDAVFADSLAPLARLAVRTRRSERRSDGSFVRASYLVHDDLVERFAGEVRRLADRHPDLWLSCTGPWPPYSFVELEEGP